MSKTPRTDAVVGMRKNDANAPEIWTTEDVNKIIEHARLIETEVWKLENKVMELETSLTSETNRRQDFEQRLHSVVCGRVDPDYADRNPDNICMSVRVSRRYAKDKPEIWDEALRQLRYGLTKELQK